MLRFLQWFALILGAVMLLGVLPWAYFTENTRHPAVVFAYCTCGLAGVYALLRLFPAKQAG